MQNHALVFLALLSIGCSKDDSDEKSTSTFDGSCAVANTVGTSDFGYCVDYDDQSANNKASIQSGCTDGYKGTFTDGTLCSVAAGEEGCQFTKDGVTFTLWLSGASWQAGDNADNAICSGGTAVTKS